MAAPCSAFSRQVVAFNASLRLGYDMNWNFSPQVLVDINVDTFVLCFVYKQCGIVENFRKFHGFVAIRECFLHKIWGVASFGTAKVSNPRKFSPQKSYSSQIRESFLRKNHILHKSAKVFSLKKFSAIWYCSMFRSSDHSPVTE